MNGVIHKVARLVLAVEKAWTRKWSFLALSLCLFLGSVMTLHALDLLPEARVNVTLDSSPLVAASAVALPASNGTEAIAEDPMKIEIPALSRSVTIANPPSTDIGVLDEALLRGAVRYPTSAKLGEEGNVVVFAHASYLPVVRNAAFKAFNGIEHLHQGDTIIVYSSTAAYVYHVKSVSKADANSVAIPLTVSGKVLTLSTCDSFGSASDRFVVIADFVESRPLLS